MAANRVADRALDDVLLACRGVTKAYQQGDQVQRVLAGVDLEVHAGQFVSIMGPSGSGKSTLLHLLGGLDRPDDGDVVLDGVALSQLSDDDRTLLRRDRVGIVYQFFNLVPVLTVEENIALPAVIAGQRPRAYRDRLERVLGLVGLADHRRKQPAELSGGMQQRAAIARALFIEPAVLLADEPTGNLDLRSGRDILELFVEAQRTLNQTVVMVTHDPHAAGYGSEVLMLRDGQFAGRLDIDQRMRGTARTRRGDPARGKAVLRWVEQMAKAPADGDMGPERDQPPLVRAPAEIVLDASTSSVPSARAAN